MVSFMPLPLYPWGKRPHYPLDRKLGGPRAGLEDMEKRKKFLILLGLKLQPHCHPAHSQYNEVENEKYNIC
jgi:hypothetical protein